MNEQQSVNSSASTSPSNPPVFLVFQGGGARGIAHVGGLAAVNELGLDIAGVAGTSAGAIMAALVAARYRADQLLNPENGTHLLQTVADGQFRIATSLFSEEGWQRISRLRDYGAIAGKVWQWVICRWQTYSGKLAAGLIGLGLGWLAFIQAPAVALGAVLSLLVVIGRIAWLCMNGLTSLDRVEKLIDQALAEGLKADKSDITFRDLEALGGLPLKLVATNVSRQSLELFSVDTTPDVRVADAVAASICLPIIFEAWTPRERYNSANEDQFVDGGLLSNLPVWTFDEERALHPEAMTIAFGLKPKSHSGGRPHWLPATIQAIVAGPPEIHFRGVERMVHIALHNKVGLLDFDARFADLSADVRNAEVQALAALEEELTSAARDFRKFLQDVLRDVGVSIFRVIYVEDWAGPLPLRLTVAVQRANDRKTMAVAYASDDSVVPVRRRLSLGPDSMSGAAWHFRDKIKFASPMRSPDDRIYSDTAWALAVAVPIVEPDDDDAEVADNAVVAILDSPTPLPAIINGTTYSDFCQSVYSSLSGYFIVEDFGRTSRRSIKWLG